MAKWFDPTLSLETQASLAIDRQRIKRLPLNQLQQETSMLLDMAYTQRQIINCTAKRVQELEISIACGNTKIIADLTPAAHRDQRLAYRGNLIFWLGLVVVCASFVMAAMQLPPACAPRNGLAIPASSQFQ
jgi:hypothetical protein